MRFRALASPGPLKYHLRGTGRGGRMAEAKLTGGTEEDRRAILHMHERYIDVNTTARICAVGHGGQIVVSANTREAVKASAPSGVRFVAMSTSRRTNSASSVPASWAL